MSESIIEISGLKKVFKVHEKEKNGILAAVKSLIVRKYRYITAVEGINLKVRKGEIRGLIGPNGAGKSTTIKVLSGILYPTEGTVKVSGFIPWLQREDYVKNIGVVLGQKSQLVWDLPAIDSFRLNKEFYKIPEKIFSENLDYFLDLMNLREIVKRPVRQLSLGERMKCELVCAMLHNPSLVYLDEPTIGLDVIAKQSVRTFVKQVNKDKGVTFILTTHDLDDIEDLCDNVTIINSGTIVYDDSLQKLKTYFDKKKVIEIRFLKEIKKEMLEDFCLEKFDGISAKIEVDLSTKDLKGELYKMFSVLPVQDININNIAIEEVIRHIYSA